MTKRPEQSVAELSARIDAQKWREQADSLAEVLRIFARKPIVNTALRRVVDDALEAYDEAVAEET
jgi:hypothetical protein